MPAGAGWGAGRGVGDDFAFRGRSTDGTGCSVGSASSGSAGSGACFGEGVREAAGGTRCVPVGDVGACLPGLPGRAAGWWRGELCGDGVCAGVREGGVAD